MLSHPFNGPPMHGAANTFIAALVRHAVDVHFEIEDGYEATTSFDELGSMAAEEIRDLQASVSTDTLALFCELSRSCSFYVARDLVDELETELDEREIDDDIGLASVWDQR